MYDDLENNDSISEEENTAFPQETQPEEQVQASDQTDMPAEETVTPVPEEDSRDVFSGSSTENEEETAAFSEYASSEDGATEAPAEETPYVEAEKIDPETPSGYSSQYGYGNTAQNGYNQGYGTGYNQGYTHGYNPGNSYGQPGYRPGYNQAPQYTAAPVPPQTPPAENKSHKGLKIFLCAVALIVVFALGAGVAAIAKNRGGNNTIKPGVSERTTADSAELTINADTGNNRKNKTSSKGDALTPAEIAEKVRNSNVGIVVYSNNSTSAAGEGSGVVMGQDSTGDYTYIITCAHVIDSPGIKVSVQTENGDHYDAEVVGYDTRTDLGVLKVKATDLQEAEFGDSDALSVGDPVYAVGNPGGVEFFGSFTGGFVSSINRPISSEIGYTMKCIQHDAAINPGNSGGMLVNQYGQVVGINSQKIADSSYEGMGFAIPISSAKQIIDDLIKYSYVPNRPKLGITYYAVSASKQYNMIAQIKGLPAGTLIINEISSDSSLTGTDARKYDMIIAVNGEDLTTADVLLEKIDNGKVGDKLTLTLCRVNSDYSIDEFDISVTLVEDKGEVETTTEAPTYVNPFDYFFNYGF